MKIHLSKNMGNLNSIACTNNPFIKGAVVSRERFNDLIKENNPNICKRCLAILNNKKVIN